MEDSNQFKVLSEVILNILCLLEANCNHNSWKLIKSQTGKFSLFLGHFPAKTRWVILSTQWFGKSAPPKLRERKAGHCLSLCV